MVELVGLPGAGKTTLVDALVAALAAPPRLRVDMEKRVSRLHHSRRSPMRWAAVVGFGLHRLGTCAALARYQGAYRPSLARGWRAAYRIVRRLHNDVLLAEDAEWSEGEGATVLDQGLVQQIWVLAFLRELPDDRAVDELFDALADHLPDAVAWVPTDAALALCRMRERLAERGRADGDFEELASGLSERDFARGERHFEQLLRRLEARGVNVLRLESGASLDDATSRLASWISAQAAEPGL